MSTTYKELDSEYDSLPEEYGETLMMTKRDLQWDLDDRMNHILEFASGDPWQSAKYYTLLRDMIKRFKTKLEMTALPKRLEDWWRYSYEISHKGIQLYVEHIHSLWVCEETGEIDEETVDQVFPLISVEAKMLTVDEYAKLYGVEQVTVRQWIRRQKLCGAEKAGKEWRISELTDVPRNGRFEQSKFKWIKELEDIPEGFGYLKKFSSAHIIRRDLNRSEEYPDKNYYVVLGSRIDREENREAHMLTDKEKDVLMAYLIANPDVLYTGDTRTFSFKYEKPEECYDEEDGE